MKELPIPATPVDPVINSTWAFILEGALFYLWDGVGPRASKREYVCNTFGRAFGATYDFSGLREELVKRVDGLNYESWAAQQPGAWCFNDEVVQDGRRRWMLSMISEFKGE